MAPKRQLKIVNLPPSDSELEDESSSDEEPQPQPQQQQQQPKPPQSDSEEELESESEEEEEKKQEPVPKAAQTPLKSQSTEGSGSDSDTDSDSDSKTLASPAASAFTVKPISSKSIPKSPEPKKLAPKSKTTAKVSNGDGEGGAVSEKKSTKRPAETEKISKVSSAKKSKVVNGDEDGGSIEAKKSGGGIVWSENDETALLQGMIDYKIKKGDPHLNLSDFHEFVNGLLSVEVTRTKLSEKMRRLRKKYKINSEKEPKGKDPVFSKPHEQKSFELSKKIWGGEGAIAEVSDGKVKSSRKKKDKKDDNLASKSELKSVGNKEIVSEEEVKDEIEEDEEGTDVLSLFPRLSKAIESEASTYMCAPKDTKEYAKETISSLGKEKARELEEGWKVVRVMEYELYAKRSEMIFKQNQAILDAAKSSKS